MLNTHELLSIFTEEITELDGTVRESFDDGRRLYVRSILPKELDIRRGDRVQGGVAVRVENGEISVSPYVFRLVCTNGAIFAHTVQTQRLSIANLDPVIGIEWPLREAIRACASPDSFEQNADEMRRSVDPAADLMLLMLPFFARHERNRRFLVEIMDRFTKEQQRTRYDLMNAVTSVARDTKDPAAKWQLEELGGAIASETPRPAFEAIERRLTPRFKVPVA